MSKERLLKNFAFLSILQVASFILPFLIVPYLVRVLGVDKFGLLAFSTGALTYFLILTDFGFNLSATREISINRGDLAKIEEIFSAVFILKVTLVICAAAIYFSALFLIDKFHKDFWLYTVSFSIVIGNFLFPLWFFQGMEEMKYVTAIQLSARVVANLATFIYVNEPSDYILVPVFSGGTLIIAGLMSLAIIWRKFGIRLKLIRYKILANYFVDSLQFFLSRASLSVYTASNTFLLGLQTGNLVVARYAMAEKVYSALQAMYQPLSGAIYPYVASQKDVKLFKRIFSFAIAVNFIVVVTLLVYADAVLRLVYGNEAGQDSILIFRILLISALFVVPSVLLGYPFLGALGHGRAANRSVMFGSLLHLVLLAVIFFSKNITAINVSICVVITEFFVFTYRIYWVNKAGLWERQ